MRSIVGSSALVCSVALSLAIGACSSRLGEPDEIDDDDDDDDATRIDAYCAKHCEMNAACAEVSGDVLADCETVCREEIPWRDGDDDCVTARWDYYDCRSTVKRCEEWVVGYGAGAACDPAFEAQLVACVGVSDGG